jgi:hypothetical protein
VEQHIYPQTVAYKDTIKLVGLVQRGHYYQIKPLGEIILHGLIILDIHLKVYQLLTHGLWFSPVSSTTKTGHHEIAEILLKVALNTKKIKSQNE